MGRIRRCFKIYRCAWSARDKGAARRKLSALEEEWRTQTPPATARAPAPRKHTLESVLSAGLARLELERGVRATAAGEGGGEKQSGKEAVAPFYSAVRVNLRSLPVHKSAPPAEEDPGVEPPPAEDDPGKGNRKER